MPKPVSKAQARLFGAIAGGRPGKAKTARNKGFSRRDARRSLRGVSYDALPPRLGPYKTGREAAAKKQKK